MPLKNIMTGQVVEESIQTDFIRFHELGQAAAQRFVEERLLPTSASSVWDPMSLLKLKCFSNQHPKQQTAGKETRLKEDKQILTRCLLIKDKRPELLPPIEKIVDEYELSNVPKSLFGSDGHLLLPTDKAKLRLAIESMETIEACDGTGNPPQRSRSSSRGRGTNKNKRGQGRGRGRAQSASVTRRPLATTTRENVDLETLPFSNNSFETNGHEIQSPQQDQPMPRPIEPDLPKVVIIDGMVEVRVIKIKDEGLGTIKDFCHAFKHRVKELVYHEARVSEPPSIEFQRVEVRVL